MTTPDPPRPRPPRRSGITTQQNAPEPSVAREDALATLLARRAAAVRERDRAAFTATLDDPSSGFGLRQLAQYDALAQLPLGTFTYGTPEPAPALAPDRVAQLGPQAWVSRVAGRYSLAGFDTAPREFESYFTVVRRDDGWRLADDTDGGTQVQLWDLPRFTVLRSSTTLVVGTGPASRLRPYLALGNLAVKRVDAVWTVPWNSRLVLVVPGTAAQMAEQTGQDKAGVAQVAAVTDGPFDPEGRAGADRVVINPSAFATLQARGQQVVVAHEATHVAIRATTNRPVPLWLSEGMADYVGYHDIGVTRTPGRRGPARPGPCGHRAEGPAVRRRLRPLTRHDRPELQRGLAGGCPHRRPPRPSGPGPLLPRRGHDHRPFDPCGRRPRRERRSGLQDGARHHPGLLHQGVARLPPDPGGALTGRERN